MNGCPLLRDGKLRVRLGTEREVSVQGQQVALGRGGPNSEGWNRRIDGCVSRSNKEWWKDGCVRTDLAGAGVGAAEWGTAPQTDSSAREVDEC